MDENILLDVAQTFEEQNFTNWRGIVEFVQNTLQAKGWCDENGRPVQSFPKFPSPQYCEAFSYILMCAGADYLAAANDPFPKESASGAFESLHKCSKVAQNISAITEILDTLKRDETADVMYGLFNTIKALKELVPTTTEELMITLCLKSDTPLPPRIRSVVAGLISWTLTNSADADVAGGQSPQPN